MKSDLYGNSSSGEFGIYQAAVEIINNTFAESDKQGDTCEKVTVNIINSVEEKQTQLWLHLENMDFEQLKFLINEINTSFNINEQYLIVNYRREDQNIVGRLLTKRSECLERIKILKIELEQKENFTFLLSQKEKDKIKSSRMAKTAEIEGQELNLYKIKNFIFDICSVEAFNKKDLTGFIVNFKNITTEDVLSLYDFEALKDEFWAAIIALNYQTLEAFIEKIKNSSLSSVDQGLIFNSRQKDKNAIGFLLEAHINFSQTKEKLSSELQQQKATGIFRRRKNISTINAKIAEINHQYEMLKIIKNCVFLIFNISLFNQEEAIGLVLDSKPATAIRALSVIYHLEDFQKEFWQAIENVSFQELVSLIEEIDDKFLLEDEISLIFNFKKEGRSAVDYLFNVYRSNLLTIKNNQNKITEITNIIDLIKNIQKKIKKDDIDNLIQNLNYQNFHSQKRLNLAELSSLISKFWAAVHSFDVTNLASLISEILSKKIHNEDQILIFNDKSQGVALDVLMKQYDSCSSRGIQNSVQKIGHFIYKMCKISVFKKHSKVYYSGKNLSAVEIIDFIFITNGNLKSFNTILVDAKEPLDLQKIDNCLRQMQNQNLSSDELALLFKTDGFVNIKKLLDYTLEINNKAKVIEEIKRLIFQIQKISCFRINSKFPADLNILDFYRLLPLDQKLNMLWDILNKEDKSGLSTVIEEIKTLDYEEKSKILNARSIFRSNLVPEGLVDINGRFSSYIGINIVGKLFIDFMSAKISRKSISDKISDYIKLIIDIHEFNINEYVIKGSWQSILDTSRSGIDNTNLYFKYSGMNILHLAILEGNVELSACLVNRNLNLKAANAKFGHNQYVNFEYPIAHPEHYMSSPAQLYERLGHSWALGDYSVKNGQIYSYNPENWSDSSGDFDDSHYGQIYSYNPENWSDSSGDSDDLHSRAWYYKKWLTYLVTKLNHVKKQNSRFRFFQLFKASPNHKAHLISEADLQTLTQAISRNELDLEITETNLQKLSIAYYHALPFMSGEYSSQQKFAIAEEIVRLCNNQTKSEKARDRFKLLKSKSLMASLGIENIGMNLKHKYDRYVEPSCIYVARKLTDLMERSDKMRSSEEYPIDYTILKQMLELHFKSDHQHTSLHREFWELAAKVSDNYKIDLSDISKFGFPFLSASKKPDNPIKYGFGWNLEEKRIDPKYESGQQLKSKKPKHRLAGFLFVIRMNLERYLDLLSQGKILDNIEIFRKNDLRLASQDPARSSNIDKQIEMVYSPKLEVNFLDCIELQDIVSAIPLVYPNYSKKFNSRWHHDVLYYNKKHYDRYSEITDQRLKEELIENRENTNHSTGIQNTYSRLALHSAKYGNIDLNNSNY